MAERDEIVAWCDELLDAGAYTDYGPNGLQVPGRRRVERVVTGVTASLALLEAAAEAGADLILAHHGLFWDFHPRALSTPMARRLRTVLDAEISVCGYHLPLDAHRSVGNNALLCEGLGLAAEPEAFAEVKGRPIGVIGRASEGLTAVELVEGLAELVGQRPLIQGAGPPEVRTVGFVSGAGASTLGEAIALGLDALVTGEPAEHAMSEATEGAIHFVAAGHYATERLGIRRLGELVAERFGVEHHFVDLPNPV